MLRGSVRSARRGEDRLVVAGGARALVQHVAGRGARRQGVGGGVEDAGREVRRERLVAGVDHPAGLDVEVRPPGARALGQVLVAGACAVDAVATCFSRARSAHVRDRAAAGRSLKRQLGEDAVFFAYGKTTGIGHEGLRVLAGRRSHQFVAATVSQRERGAGKQAGRRARDRRDRQRDCAPGASHRRRASHCR